MDEGKVRFNCGDGAGQGLRHGGGTWGAPPPILRAGDKLIQYLAILKFFDEFLKKLA